MYSRYFNVGQVVVTKSIHEYMENNMQFAREIKGALQRYIAMDWGELCEEDKELNNHALTEPDDLYLLAAYKTSKGKVYIITNGASFEPGDNVTTICFPEER